MLARSISRFHSVRVRFEGHVPSGPFHAVVWEFFLFVFKQAWACLFGGTLLALFMLTRWLWPHHAWLHLLLARYDFLFLAALCIQIALLVLRMETVREAKVILVFHAIGTCMELFKTSAGSWSYPELTSSALDGSKHVFFHLGHVPLFSGFMYAAVGSYLVRTSRIMDIRYTRYPSQQFTAALAALIYLNFFTHHFFPDIRIGLFAGVAILFGPTTVYFRCYQKYRHMPLIVGFGLVAFFIWAAENIGTFAAAWTYPNQKNGWQMVQFGKYGSWYLLMIISFVLVSFVHRPSPPPVSCLSPENETSLALPGKQGVEA
jgi:uncharacterized membrane protein YoaT (DUF817 family)